MMRIISGKYKGIPLLAPETKSVRPTGDKVKQALFTKLQFEIADKVVLDLFSGSGALGIEAISRNAKKVIFVDNNVGSIKLTKQNLSKIKENAEVIKSDYELYLKTANIIFDIILIDPPYANKDAYTKSLQIIYEKKLLAKEGVIVCEHSREDNIVQPFFTVSDTKSYGTVTLTYLKY